MDERKEGCEKESSQGSSGNFDKFKWMEILLAIFFLTVKAYVFGDVLHAEDVVQQERATSETRWTQRSSATTSSSSTKCLFPHYSSDSCQLQSQSESLCTSNDGLGGKTSISLNPYSLFLYCSICVVWRGAAGGFGPWRPCWPQIQENHCLNLLKSRFSSQTMYSENGHTLVFCVIKCIRILMVCLSFCDQFSI